MSSHLVYCTFNENINRQIFLIAEELQRMNDLKEKELELKEKELFLKYGVNNDNWMSTVNNLKNNW